MCSPRIRRHKIPSHENEDLDRLTDVEYHDSDTEAFVMDLLGNRTSVTKRDASTDTYALDSATNRYDESAGGPYDVTCAYDAAGNTTQDKDGYTYWYDYENRVVRIEDSSEVTVALYDYDALGRRIRMIDSAASTMTLYYYNPDCQCLAEYDAAGPQAVQLRYFVYGNYIDEPLVMHRQSDGEDYYYGHDHLYSTVVLLDDAGNVVERYEYDAYGTAHIMDASYNPRTASAYGNPYTFTGRRLDVLDGGNLLRMHYRHRDYDAYAGRFVQHDPKGYVDGIGLYAYVSNMPVRYTDPSGLSHGFPVMPPGWAPPPSLLPPWVGPLPPPELVVDTSCNLELACDPVQLTCWRGRVLRFLGIRHCEIHDAGLAPDSDELFEIRRTYSGKLLDGAAKGKQCSDATCSDIRDCVYEVRRKIPWGQFYPNCHTQTETVLFRCCLESDWTAPIVAGPIIGFPCRDGWDPPRDGGSFR